MAAFDASKLNIQFMRYRKGALLFSALLIVISIVSLFTRGVNFSVDFAGGVAMQIEMPAAVDIAQVRSALVDVGHGQAVIQAYDERTVLIRYHDSGEEVRRQMTRTLEEKFGGVKILSIDTVGPVVGQELRRQAFIAIALAIVGILLYMAFRFTPRFGVAAVLSLVHDTIIMLGVYSITGREISTSFIAAILTVIGYSLNDSIVVLDRIRENWTQLRSRGPVDLINSSINQTLSRTINTSITTLLPVLAMFFLGGEVISNLAFAFLVGIIVGTYSSIYVASSVLAEWYLKDHPAK